MNFAALSDAVKAIERAEGAHGRRIVKVFCADKSPSELWYGTFGNAPVESGPNGYTFSDGETVTL